jgi:streptogramin lyase
MSESTSDRASATIDCNPAPIIYSHSPGGIEKYNLSTGQFTNITNSPSQFFFDIGVTPNGRLYGVDSGGGDLYQIDKSTGATTAVGTVTLPPNTNFNMLAFDKYGKGWFVADGGAKLMSFDPTVSGTITPTEVVSNLQTAGFPSGNSAGDVFFVDGDMYIAWASSDNAPRDGVRLIRLDMTDTTAAYTSTGAAGTATDLGKIGGNYIWGMAVYDGGIYVANGDKISRLNNLPTTADVNRTIEVTDIATGNIGVIYGMTAEGEANVDPCNTLRDFRCNAAPIIYTHSPSGIEKYNLSTGQFTNITNSPSQFFFDIGVTPNGRLYGVDSGGGDLYQIGKTAGVASLVGTVTLPPNTNFNMLAFDKYGKGWFVADGGAKLMSFDPTAVVSGTITPTEVVSNLQTAGFPSGSSAGDVFFVDGDMYIAWASSDNAPRDGVRLIRLDMTDTSTAYTATGAAGTATDLGKIGGNYIWGMAVYDGGIYVANGDKISRLNNLPTTADVNRTIAVTDIATGNIGVIFGMSAEGEAEVDSCATVQTFINRSLLTPVTTPSSTSTTTPSTTTTTPVTATTSPVARPVSQTKKLSATLPTAGARYEDIFMASIVLMLSGLMMARRRRDGAI